MINYLNAIIENMDQERPAKSFGDLITELQGEMSTQYLAKAVGLSRNQLYLIKANESGTTRKTVGKFADIFEITDAQVLEEFYRLAGFAVPPGRITKSSSRTPNPFYQKIGTLLKNRREELGFSAGQLAHELGITQPGYSAYESGKNAIPLENLAKLSKILRKPLEWFVGDMSDVEADDEEILAFYHGLPPEMRPTAKLMLRGMVREIEREYTTHGKKAE